MLASTVQFSKNNQIHQLYCAMLAGFREAGSSSAADGRSLKDTQACSLRTQQRTDLFTQPPDDLSTQASLQYSLIRQPDV
jgi:hypothetical protein